MKHTFTIILTFLATACASAAETKKMPNIVIILADDLGWADLSCYGSTFHETPHLDGKNILPLLKGGREPLHESIQWHFPHYGNTDSGPCSSIRVGDWKLIEWFENDSIELFNLTTDMGETTNLAAKHPHKTEELKKRLAVWHEQVDANMLRPKPTSPVPERPRPASPQTIKPQGDFAATANVRVEKLVKDAGYRLHAAAGKAGFALKKLARPLQGKSTFKFRCSTAAGHEFPKRWVNGFLTISDGANPYGHIHIGAFFGGQKKLTVIEGPLTPNTPHTQPMTENGTPLAFTAHLDLTANEIVLEERGGARLKAKLEHSITQITHIGYSALDAVTEFSHWKAAD